MCMVRKHIPTVFKVTASIPEGALQSRGIRDMVSGSSHSKSSNLNSLLLAGTLKWCMHKVVVNVFLQDCPHKHQLVHYDICELPSNLEEMQYEPNDLTQPMHDDSVGPVLPILPCIAILRGTGVHTRGHGIYHSKTMSCNRE